MIERWDETFRRILLVKVLNGELRSMVSFKLTLVKFLFGTFWCFGISYCNLLTKIWLEPICMTRIYWLYEMRSLVQSPNGFSNFTEIILKLTSAKYLVGLTKYKYFKWLTKTYAD